MAAARVAQPPGRAASERVQKAVQLALLATATVVTAAVGFHVATGALALSSPPPCVGGMIHRDDATGVKLIAVSVGAFLLGHVVAGWQPAAYAKRSPHKRGGVTWRLVHFALTGFLALGALLLLYEAIGLTNYNGLQPITHYVRCGKAQSAFYAGAFSSAVMYLLGQFLWYPWRTRT